MTGGDSVTVLDRRGNTWPSALGGELGEHSDTDKGAGALRAQALVEDELGHGCRGVMPVGGRLLPQRDASGGGKSGCSGGLTQVPQDGFHPRARLSRRQ